MGVCLFVCFNQSSILYTSVYTCQSQSPNSAHHHPHPHRGLPPLVSIRLFSTSVSQLLPCKPVHLYHFSRFHIHALIYDIWWVFLFPQIYMLKHQALVPQDVVVSGSLKR